MGDTLYLRQHRIPSGKQTITALVPHRPAPPGVDPLRKFVERERDGSVPAVRSDMTGCGPGILERSLDKSW